MSISYDGTGRDVLDQVRLRETVYMAEGVGIRSRPERLRAPARGPRPLAPARGAGHPMKGAHPLQNPRSNPTQLRSDYGKDGVVTFL